MGLWRVELSEKSNGDENKFIVHLSKKIALKIIVESDLKYKYASLCEFRNGVWRTNAIYFRTSEDNWEISDHC